MRAFRIIDGPQSRDVGGDLDGAGPEDQLQRHLGRHVVVEVRVDRRHRLDRLDLAFEQRVAEIGLGLCRKVESDAGQCRSRHLEQRPPVT